MRQRSSAIGKTRPAYRRIATAISISHFDQERGCVVPTSRSTSAQYQAVRHIEALRLVRCTQPRSTECEVLASDLLAFCQRLPFFEADKM